MVAMAIVSISNLWGYSIAGISIIVGIAFFLPDFIEHIYGRMEFMVSLDKLLLLILQLAILALGEEIAWRGFSKSN